MDIITDTNIITYCCTGLLIVGGIFFVGLLVRMGKRPNASYMEFPVTKRNIGMGDED